MKKILHLLSSLLKDGTDDEWSTTRFAMLFTVIISNVAIFSVWAAVCWIKKDIIEIPTTIVSLYSLANTIVVAGKVVQKSSEVKESIASANGNAQNQAGQADPKKA